MSRSVQQPCGFCLANGLWSCTHSAQTTLPLHPSTRSSFAPDFLPELSTMAAERHIESGIAFHRSTSGYESMSDLYMPNASSSQFPDLLPSDDEVQVNFDLDLALDPSLIHDTQDSTRRATTGNNTSLPIVGSGKDLWGQHEVLGQTSFPPTRSTAYSRDGRYNSVTSNDSFGSAGSYSLNIAAALNVQDAQYTKPSPSLPGTHRTSFERLAPFGNSHLGTSMPFPNINEHYLGSNKHSPVITPPAVGTNHSPFRTHILNGGYNDPYRDPYRTSRATTHQSIQYTNAMSAPVSWQSTQSRSFGAPHDQQNSRSYNSTTVPTSNSGLSFEGPTSTRPEYPPLLGNGKQAVSVPQSTRTNSECGTLHECSECKERLPSNKLLDVHTKREHKLGYNHNCSMEACLDVFQSPSDMKRHVDEVHNQSKDWPCDYCMKPFGRWYKLRDHMKKLHKDMVDLAAKLAELSSLVSHSRRKI
jgi:hypothetical protein